MADSETKLTPVDTNDEDIKVLTKRYDDLYAKVIQLMDEFDEMRMMGVSGSGSGKELVCYNAEVVCDEDHPGYVYFRIDEDMTSIKEIYVDVYPLAYRSPVTL